MSAALQVLLAATRQVARDLARPDDVADSCDAR